MGLVVCFVCDCHRDNFLRGGNLERITKRDVICLYFSEDKRKIMTGRIIPHLQNCWH